MDTVCQNTNCTYRSTSGFCVKDFVFLNALGQCSEFWNKNGTPKAIYNYRPAQDKKQ